MIFIFAFATSAVSPTLGAGFTSIFSQASNGVGLRMGYRTAAGGDTSGTWTNAAFLMCGVYRGGYSGAAGIGGASSGTNVSGSQTTIAGIATFTDTSSKSWVVSAGASLQTTSMSTPALGTLRGTWTSASSRGIWFDSAFGVNGWGQKLSNNGTNAVGGGGSVEMLADLRLNSSSRGLRPHPFSPGLAR